MLIFHLFPGRGEAEAFARAASWRNGRQELELCFPADADELPDELAAGVEQVWLLDHAAWVDRVDPFPYELTPPIVLVPRDELERETLLEQLVEAFGGRFAGT
jgi:hypothetical protein